MGLKKKDGVRWAFKGDRDSAVVAVVPGSLDSSTELLIQKNAVYGPSRQSHENIGLAWQALLQQHYGIALPHAPPAWLVELMLVAFKVQRSARVFQEDNFTDLRNYANFAERDQREDFAKEKDGAIGERGNVGKPAGVSRSPK